MRSHLLVAEADSGRCRALADSLALEGYEVRRTRASDEAVDLVAQRTPAIILISEDMPSLGGADLLSVLRRLTDAPVVVVGAGDSMAAVKHLLQGADLYLRWPQAKGELVSRVRVLLRRCEGKSGPSFRRVKGANLEDLIPAALLSSLTGTESRLLGCLVDRLGQLVTHDELMRKVWGGLVNSLRVRFYIHSLRKKLGKSAQVRLHTHKGVGYRLVKITLPAARGA